MSFNLKGKVHVTLPEPAHVICPAQWELRQCQRGLLMVPLGQQPWWQTDRADRWHTFGGGKSLLCWQRARFSPSCGKCELILYAFHSEGETRNRSPEEPRGVTSVVCVHVYAPMYFCAHPCAHVRDYANPSEFSSDIGRSSVILSEMFTVFWWEVWMLGLWRFT